MGVGGSASNEQRKDHNKIGTSKKPESIQQDSELHPINVPIVKASKSVCKIITPKDIGSGFLIKFFKDQHAFFCLMTNEHVIKKGLIDKKGTITFYYDSESEMREICLNPEERFIKEFTDMKIDATVVEILPEDDIPKNYFLTVLLDYLINYKKLIGKEITIIQYPKYEFAHGASTLEGSSGSPIFLKGTTKVIGIHKGSDDKKIANFGDFIYPIYNYFINFSKNNNELDNTNDLVNERNNKDISIPIQKNPSIEKLNQMTIIYEINKYEPHMRLFGEKFIYNNKNNCYLLIVGQKRELCGYLYLTPNQIINDILEIKLIETK